MRVTVKYLKFQSMMFCKSGIHVPILYEPKIYI